MSNDKPVKTETWQSARISIPPKNHESSIRGKSYIKVNTSVQTQMEYTPEKATALAKIMCQFKDCMTKHIKIHGQQHLVTHSLKKGLQKFREQGEKAILKEMDTVSV